MATSIKPNKSQQYSVEQAWDFVKFVEQNRVVEQQQKELARAEVKRLKEVITALVDSLESGNTLKLLKSVDAARAALIDERDL